MAASSSSSSSSSSVTIDGFTYDVFLSFRGEDSRHGFTGYLWKALHDRGIKTFIDDEEIRKGEEITKSLLEAIEQSRMAIVVLSQNYATSSFCLDELSHILDCIRGKGRLVWPVFYEVDPSDVRKLSGTYGEAMTTHEKMSSRYKTDRLHKWKNALHQVANLSGTHYKWKNGGGYDYKFIEEIVNEVSREIKPFTLYVADYLVGLETRKQDVKTLLNVGSNDEVHMVGIHGIGGIGKTTLALAVYNSIAHQFERSCFLESVRENSEKHGLIYLQKIILSEVVGEKGIELTSVRQGISIIQQRLRQKKVLLILDDVDKLEQLVAIVGEPKWFSPRSRVIITTRDKGLLTSHGVKSTYGMKELNKKDALELLRWKVFKTDKVSPDYVDVLNRVVTYASGLPLALKVISSHLYKKTIVQCKSTLDRYERIPNKEILKILKVSFDALEEEEKSVFLDIACCFKGHKLTNVEKILHAHHGNSKKHHINVLVEKSLIKINKSGDVTLHDLIEDMGKEIVRQESPEEPGRRSRLWLPADIVHLLKENTGTSKNEIIYLNSKIEVECDGEVFKKMENLKTLIIRCDRFYEYPKHLPNSLRVLQWHCSSWGVYPSPSSQVLLFDSHPTKHVLCEIDYNYSPSILCRNLFKKKFENMRVLEINCCSLTHTGDISGLPNLEEISFSNWENLSTIDDSIGLLDKLKILYVHKCYKLTSFPPLMLPSLEILALVSCAQLESVPTIHGSLGKLKILKVKDCYMLKSIPSLKLPLLEILDLSRCFTLESIPPMYGLLGKLKILRVDKCITLANIPPLKLPSLKELNISQCESLLTIPLVGDGSLGKLKILRVDKCITLRSIPPLMLPSLEELNISHCDSLLSIPLVGDGSLGKLKIFSVRVCKKLASIPHVKFPSLEKLDLTALDSLKNIPFVGDRSLGDCQKHMSFPPLKLPSLVELNVSYCDTLESVSSIDELGKLKILSITCCRKLKSIPPLKLPSLVKLSLSCSYSLESIPPMDGSLGKLKFLSVKYCRKLRSIPPLKMHSLEELDLSYCDSLESILPMDGLLGKLKRVRVKCCPKLRSIPPLTLPLLEELNLSQCGSLESIAPLDMSMGKLKILSLDGCSKLTSIPPLELPLLEQLDLSRCDHLKCFPKILGVMKNITEFNMDHTPIKKFPFSFQNLTRLQTLKLEHCGNVQLPSSIVVMSELTTITMMFGGWLFSKEDKGEEKGSPTQCSQVEFITLKYCNLSDESLAISLKWFANAKELNLSSSNFTILPKCIEQCQFLWKLDLDYCEELQEIKGIPPSLKTLSAMDCKSLTSSCKSKLLNQELHEVGNTNFLLPLAEIPEWFGHHCSSGMSISFWFRNKFPAVALCFVSPLRFYHSRPPLKVIINGNTFFYKDVENKNLWLIWRSSESKVYHLHLYHMQMEKFNENMDEAFSENKWNHAKIVFGFHVTASGIHVLKEQEEDDVKFTSPYNHVSVSKHNSLDCFQALVSDVDRRERRIGCQSSFRSARLRTRSCHRCWK